eukprot:CAMPEP_0174753720 /NCGR_PEP_ID=MMETSP1094-20130205/104589_1 /TAXON_ID=156173 /ORGANISM="Chrysochromulina brevifilum, Strain UTEX LB 985" /LENGTH=79 /DNA_ID=CAMNT_0015959529 /DNA_START=18 /DNA_END=253 /DNA_ORIENTATION=+
MHVEELPLHLCVAIGSKVTVQVTHLEFEHLSGLKRREGALALPGEKRLSTHQHVVCACPPLARDDSPLTALLPLTFDHR